MNVHVRPHDVDPSLDPSLDPGLDPRTRNDEMVRRASDPAASAWVSANAGAGKTFLLTRRVVRLLLGGVAPSRVLCLTYTRAAAAEMTARVHGLLGTWARMDDRSLARELSSVTGAKPSRAAMERSRALFAGALDTPGGLKIQTIHGFCEAVLHRFPLEANVSGRFRMVDDAERAALMRELTAELTAESGMAASDGAVDAVLALAQAHGLEKLFGDLDRTRNDLDAAHDGHGAALADVLAGRLGLEAGATRESVLASVWPLPGLDAARLGEITGAARHHGGSTNEKHADLIDAMLGGCEETRLDALVTLTHNAKGEPRASFSKAGKPVLSGGFTAKVLDDLPWLHEAMADAHVHVGAARDRLHSLALLDASRHALHLGRRLHDRWARLKHSRGLMDFDDLIARTAQLLDRDGGAGWVHYKLDRGIDHVLVDEAQDTSPLQWRVIARLTDEFHTGEADRPRTVFAVGDPKQSIYSFQGARPEGFVDRGGDLRRLYRRMDRTFHDTTLRLSFRSTPDVLGAVDAVFGGEGAVSLGGLEKHADHVATRRQRGFVEAWRVLRAAPGDDRGGLDWTDALDAVAEDDPRMVLARRIAARVKGWIEGAEPIETEDGTRPITAGDVMVLVRKRDAFTAALTRAFKDLDVPVAGEDRLALTAHIATEDLIALGTAALDPHDDLAVASLFKSPLLGLGEDDLFELAHTRADDESLYRALRRRGPERAEWLAASETMAEWRDRADREPPFEFYARILGPDGGRRRFIARLGAEAGDVLDAFLTRALEERADVAPGLEAFLASLRAEAPIVKREMDGRANEVRVMTVHAAKGLEAAATFLVCPGSPPVSHTHLPALLPLRAEGPGTEGEAPPLVWTAPRLKRPEVVDRARKAVEAAAADEYRRLLYVGMTRARDRLVVCGTATVRGGGEDTWLATVRRALEATGRCAPCPDCDDPDEPDWRYRVDGPRADGASGDTGAGGSPSASPCPSPSPVPGGRGPDGTTDRTTDGTTDRTGGGTRADPTFGKAVGAGNVAAAPSVAGGGRDADDPMPDWTRRVAPEAEPPRPLAPAGTTALIEGEGTGRAGPVSGMAASMGRAADVSALAGGAPGDRGDPLALRRGTLMHRLLQVLPDWPEKEREDAARRYLGRACSDLPGEWCESLTTAALGVLADPAMADLLGPGGRAEVAVMGTLEVGGAPRPVSGTIDRIALLPGRAVLVDYKTGRRVPGSAAGVPPLHVAQMALYRALAAPLLAGRRVECALVYTEGPRRIDLEPWRLDAALARVLAGGGAFAP